MNRKKVDIESQELKKNPFLLPENYIAGLRNSVSDKISEQSYVKVGRRRFVIGTAFAAVISFVLIVGYLIIPTTASEVVTGPAEIDIIESGFLSSSFIDFYYDDENDSENRFVEEEVSEEEIISFLSENANIMLLASLE